ncbi:MAG: hypothetical protein QM820_59300 [Minicystis sp.]
MRDTSRLLLLASFFLSVTAACQSSEGSGTGGSGGTSASSTSATTSTSGSGGAGGVSGTGGSTPDGGPIDKAKDCAATFGQALTASFGRLDGTVLAVVKPSDTQCPLPNSDHLILQVVMNGEPYRLVVNIKSDFGSPDVFYRTLDHALPGPAWAEGWHTGLGLDYVADFGVHADASFTAHPLSELADIVTDAITLGQKVSVYADSSGGSSAHKVHRNGSNLDGAIILDPDGPAPKALLFHFATQSF